METIFQAAVPGSSAAVSALFSAIWEGAAVALSVVCCLRLLPRLNAASRSFLWMNVFLLLVALHILPCFQANPAVGKAAPAAPLSLDSRWGVAIAGIWAILSAWRGTQLILSAVRLHRLAGRGNPRRA